MMRKASHGVEGSGRRGEAFIATLLAMDRLRRIGRLAERLVEATFVSVSLIDDDGLPLDTVVVLGAGEAPPTCLVVPLIDDDGGSVGSFCVGAGDQRVWSALDRSVIADLAALVGEERALLTARVDRDLFNTLVVRERQVAAALAATEARLRGTMDGLFIFVGLLDVDGTLTEANRAALTAAGLDAPDVLGRPYWETYWWSWSPEVQEQLKDAIDRAAHGESSRYDVKMRLAGDQLTTIDFQLVPVRDAEGSVIGMVLSGTDVSERVSMQNQMAWLADQEALRRVQIESIFALSGALTGAVNVDDVVDAVTHRSADVVGAAFSNLALLDADAGQIELRNGPNLDSDIGARWPRLSYDDSSPLGRAIRSGAPVFVSSMAEIEAQFPSGAADAAMAGFSAVAAVPVPRAKAGLGFAWKSEVNFDVELRRVLRVTADLVGDALERARLYEKEHMVADLLQRTMLPDRLPEIEGAVVDALYEPGTAGLHVGGDWYDVVDLGGGRSMIAVGDVVGHGIEAAAAMGKLRSAFAALAHNGGVRQVTERLDRFAYEVDTARLSSVVVAEFDGSNGTLDVVLAGHLPALIRRNGGSVDQLPDPGPPLGIDRELAREVHRTVLAPGELLVLYTDGLVEERRSSIDDAIGRLGHLLRGLAESERAPCQYLYDGMGRPKNDDVAILTLQRTIV